MDWAANGAVIVGPAGVAGQPIGLGLSKPSDSMGELSAVTISAVPAGWNLNAGTSLDGRTWQVQPSDLATLAITPPATFTGAMMLQVTEFCP